jgi:hypothetical protein
VVVIAAKAFREIDFKADLVRMNGQDVDTDVAIDQDFFAFGRGEHEHGSPPCAEIIPIRFRAALASGAALARR